jgi:uncharacterized damage-inducible protein DinB
LCYQTKKQTIMAKNLIPIFLKEINEEAATTRKMLQLVPEDKYSWKPHEKSMSMQQLAVHLAEIPEWASMAIRTDGIDFAAQPYVPTPVNNNKDLLNLLEQSVAEANETLNSTTEEVLDATWTMRAGEQVFATLSKADTIRHSLSQTIHHRAQLGVYLRLLNVPIPGSYGPSADEQMM